MQPASIAFSFNTELLAIDFENFQPNLTFDLQVLNRECENHEFESVRKNLDRSWTWTELQTTQSEMPDCGRRKESREFDELK